MLETYLLILTCSFAVCEECGSPGPYVTTGTLNAVPNTFMSPVPVFRTRMARVLQTSRIARDRALTSGEEWFASNGSVLSSILYVALTDLSAATLSMIPL